MLPCIRASIGAALLAALLFVPGARAADTGVPVDPGQTVSALWRAMSHEAGVAADTATLRAIFHADAVVFGSRLRDGRPSLKRTAINDFLKAFEPVGEAGFHECEIARSIEAYDRFATVYSVVESRTDPSASTPDFTGVNSLQLYRDDAGWKIISLYYHVETAGHPIPEAADRTGQCMR
ncbi:MAG TPA: nuclear transport factor 2 family protein [Xanthomonadaceae bacterium]